MPWQADDVSAVDGGGDTVMVLDGGFATELERRGHDLSDDLWSARLLLDDPDEVRDTHLAFYRAGAQVATTASYQASFDGFARHGLSREESVALMRRSVTLAREAAALADRPGLLVAASVGPYGAVLADGSEYRGDYGVSDAALRDFHQPRAEVLASAGADLLAIETVPSEQEAAVLLGVLAELPSRTRAWLSLTCADGSTTRAGEEVDRVFGLARGHDQIVAVGVNCTAPQYVEELVTPRGGGERQASHRLSEQRRSLGRGRPPVGRGRRGARCRRRGSVGGRRCAVRRRLLPGQLAGHRSARGGVVLTA